MSPFLPSKRRHQILETLMKSCTLEIFEMVYGLRQRKKTEVMPISKVMFPFGIMDLSSNIWKQILQLLAYRTLKIIYFVAMRSDKQLSCPGTHSSLWSIDLSVNPFYFLTFQIALKLKSSTKVNYDGTCVALFFITIYFKVTFLIIMVLIAI